MFVFFSSRRRHTRYWRDWSSDVCSSDLEAVHHTLAPAHVLPEAPPAVLTGHIQPMESHSVGQRRGWVVTVGGHDASSCRCQCFGDGRAQRTAGADDDYHPVRQLPVTHAVAPTTSAYPFPPPWAMRPPSTGISAPVMYDASSDSRKTTSGAISAGCPMRPSAVTSMPAALRSGSIACTILVSKNPGWTMLTRMPRGPYSRLAVRDRPRRPYLLTV